MEWLSPVVGSIVVAIITAGGTLLVARQSRQNTRDIKPIKEILANSPGATSLDGVIKILQDELSQTSKRHETEIKYQNIQIEELRNALSHCQGERSRLTVEFEDMQKQLKEHEKRLNNGTT